MVLSISLGLIALGLILSIIAIFVPGRRILNAAVAVLAFGALLAHVPVTQ